MRLAYIFLCKPFDWDRRDVPGNGTPDGKAYLPPGCFPLLLLVPGPTFPSLEVLPPELGPAPVVRSRIVPLRPMVPLPVVFELPATFVVAELLMGPLSEPALPWLD